MEWAGKRGLIKTGLDSSWQMTCWLEICDNCYQIVAVVPPAGDYCAKA